MLPKPLPPPPAPAQGAEGDTLVLLMRRAGPPQLGALLREDEKSGFAQQQSSGFLGTRVCLGSCRHAVREVVASAWRRRAVELRVLALCNRPALSSQERLSDPNYRAFFPPKASGLIALILRSALDKIMLFLNMLHHAARVEKSAQFVLVSDFVRGNVIDAWREEDLSWVPRLLEVKLPEMRF